MSLLYLVKREMMIVHVLPLSCYRKKIQEFISPQLSFPNALDLNPVDNSMWEILQKKVYKTRVTDLELSTTTLLNGCCNDA